MMEENYDMMSNAELRIRMTEMEKEYEAVKAKIKENIDKMNSLDKRYIKASETLIKRTKGKI